MCGRTVSTLNHKELRRACTYTNNRGRRMRPGWRNRGSGGGGSGGGGGTKRGASGSSQKQHQAMQGEQADGASNKRYQPSYNIAPSRATPVLVSRRHFEDKTSSDEETSKIAERDLMPMTWGLVPSWHKGTAKDMAYKMNNCRSEGMLEKVSFKKPFEKGQRCVVLADGFYEWKTDKLGAKQPYFIYFTQDHPPTDLSIDREDDEECDIDQEVVNEPTEVNESDQEWTGHRLLTMAGLFDKWCPPEGGDPLYTYTVITVESNDSFSWLHHRMPAILEGEEEIRSWLEFGSMDRNKKASSLISPRRCLSFHPVTRSMGNIRYKDPDCIKPIELGKPEKPKSAGSKFMDAWVSKGSKAGEAKSPLKQERGGAKKEEPGKKKGTLMNWFVKKESTKDDDSKKRLGDAVTMKEEEPSPKKSRIC